MNEASESQLGVHPNTRRLSMPRLLTVILVSTVSAVLAEAAAQAQSAPGRSPVPGAPASMTAFVDVTVVPMDRERVLANHTVLIKGGRITALAPSAKVKVPSEAVRINGHGQYLIPGLSDCHTHMAVTWTTDGMTERDLFLFLANGVTTIRNMDYWGDEGLGLRRRAQAAAGTLWSPYIYTSGEFPRGREVPTEAAQHVAAYQATGYDFIKPYSNWKSEYVDSLAAAARRSGLTLMGHVPDKMSFERALASLTSIEHLTEYVPRYVFPGPWPEDAGFPNLTVDQVRQQLDLSRIPGLVTATRRAGVWNCATMMLNEIAPPEVRSDPNRGDVKRDTLALWPEMRYVAKSTLNGWMSQFKSGGGGAPGGRFLNANRQLLKALQDSGAGLLTGTDTPVQYVVPGFSLQRELQAFVHAGLTPYQALAASTRNMGLFAKTFLKASEETGTVAVGTRADLVLLRDNPLKDIRNTMHPAGVMVGGRWLPRSEIDRRLAEIETFYAASP